MKYELTLVTGLTMVIVKKISSRNPLKNFSSTMVASCLA